MSRRTRTAVQAVAVLAVAGGLMGVALPHVLGTTLTDALHAVRPLGLWPLLGLVLLWLAGLWAHTWVATAALPRLSHRQALALNLSGSAASNIAPLGGALGVGVGWAMARSWGHAAVPFSAFTLVVNLCNILVKLALPVVAVGLLVADDTLLPSEFVSAAGIAAGALAGLVGLLVACGASAGVAGAAARVVERAVHTLLPRRAPGFRCERAVLDARVRVLSVLAGGWPRLLAGSVAYVVLQAALLYALLHLLGSPLPPGRVFAGFAVGRALSLLPISPGGVGIADTGAAAALVALGGAPDVVAAATLVYAAITFALEIPVGGVVGCVWWWRRGRHA